MNAQQNPQENWVAYDSRKRKLPRLTAWDKLDQLIAYYEAHKPGMEKILPGGVSIEAEKLDKKCSTISKGKWLYKGWILTQAEIPPKGREKMKINK